MVVVYDWEDNLGLAFVLSRPLFEVYAEVYSGRNPIVDLDLKLPDTNICPNMFVNKIIFHG